MQDIRRRTRRRVSAEEKIRIVLEGLRGEESIATLCRKEGLAPNLYYRWSQAFLEALALLTDALNHGLLVSRTMREAFIGFDSAWAGKVPGGIVWATFEDQHLAAFVEPRLAGFNDAAQIIDTLRSECDYVLVAVDQPTVVPNETGSRPVDGVARGLISKLGSGVQPANRGKQAMFGSNAPIWRFLERLGASENPPVARTSTHGLHLIEVFPALALPALEPEILQRGRAAHYNPATKKTFSRNDWRLVGGGVRRRASALGIAPLAHWAGQQIGLAVPTKRAQDCLDAAICLIVALEWRRAPRARVAVIGDGRTGYIVTPVSPETRHILERAAIATGVAFDARWPATERPPEQHDGPDTCNARPTSRSCGRTRHDETAPGHRDRILFDQTLLTHCLVEAARAGRTLTYGDVACRFGIPWSQGASAALASALKRIGDDNQRRGEPQLMALVVSKKSGTPGRGFFQATGIGLSTESEQRTCHQEHLRQVWAFDWPD